MKEFLVGILVIVMMGVLSVVGVLIFPLLLVMGIFLRILLGFFVLLFVICLIGKVTLVVIELLSKKNSSGPRSSQG